MVAVNLYVELAANRLHLFDVPLRAVRDLNRLVRARFPLLLFRHLMLLRRLRKRRVDQCRLLRHLLWFFDVLVRDVVRLFRFLRQVALLRRDALFQLLARFDERVELVRFYVLFQRLRNLRYLLNSRLPLCGRDLRHALF